MNARYLFRGKYGDTWVYGTLSQLVGGLHVYDSTGKVHFKVDPTTIGQCTGISAIKSYRGDKPEDLLIFEGDVLRVPIEHYGPDHPVRIVEWSGGGYRIRGVGSETGFCALTSWPMVNTAEIIGNVHDNPELLKGSTDS